jgi:hypothetical protein
MAVAADEIVCVPKDSAFHYRVIVGISGNTFKFPRVGMTLENARISSNISAVLPGVKPRLS